MASIQAKIGWKRMWKRENKKQKSSLRFVSTRRVIENSKKKAKKFKKLKYTIMASFQAKIGWKRPRKSENKNCHSVPFYSYPTRNWKFLKNSKKFKKLNKSIMASFQAKIGWKTQRKRENKNCHSVPFHSYPTRNWKFEKKKQKN